MPLRKSGCFELYASQRAILENYAARQKKENVTISEFLKDYDANLPLAHEMMDLFVKYISIGINNIINTFNTDIIVLNSAFPIIFLISTKEFQNTWPDIKTETVTLSPQN